MSTKLLEYNDYDFYQLVCNNKEIDLSYIGSTHYWYGRMFNHAVRCHNPNDKEYNLKIYKIIREHGGWENWKPILIGHTDHLTSREARLIAEEYRKKLGATANTRRCAITQEERTESNRVRARQYRRDHPEYKTKCECPVCGGRYTRSNKTMHFKTKKHEQAEKAAQAVEKSE